MFTERERRNLPPHQTSLLVRLSAPLSQAEAEDDALASNDSQEQTDLVRQILKCFTLKHLFSGLHSVSREQGHSNDHPDSAGVRLSYPTEKHASTKRGRPFFFSSAQPSHKNHFDDTLFVLFIHSDLYLLFDYLLVSPIFEFTLCSLFWFHPSLSSFNPTLMVGRIFHMQYVDIWILQFGL